jgi:hypothetical protein
MQTAAAPLRADGSSPSAADACRWSSAALSHPSSGVLHLHTAHLVRGDSEAADCACMLGLVHFLARRPETLRIAPLHKRHTLNDVAAGILQGGVAAGASLTTAASSTVSADVNSAAAAGDAASVVPKQLWELGVTGAGEVIGVSDTGLDDSSCFFADAVHGPTPRGSWPNATGDVHTDRRKVRQI